MKNSSLVIKFFIISLFNFILVVNSTFAKEVKFKAFEIETYDEGNLIIGKKDAEAIIDNEIEIFADKVTYNKKKN